MALSNLDKDNITRLFTMLSLNEDNKIEIIKKNYSSFAQLKLIAEQIYSLQQKAEEIISAAKINDRLHNIEMNSKKVCGNYYYHYKMEDKEILSMISPDEWNIYSEFLGKYLYNYDNLFYLQE
jgi:hypothetical protein